LTFLGPHGWQSETRTGVPLPRAPQRRNRAEAECVQLRSRPRGRATRGFFRSFRRTCPVRRKRVAFVTVNLLARSFRQRFVPLLLRCAPFRKCDSPLHSWSMNLITECKEALWYAIPGSNQYSHLVLQDETGQKISPKLLRPVSVSTYTVEVSFCCTRAFRVV
jgi:hypothetical protein